MFAGQDPSGVAKLGMGCFSGGVAAFCSNPIEVTLVRMQADGRLPPAQRRNYSNIFNGLYRIGAEDGAKAYMAGVVPTMVRAMIVNMLQVCNYNVYATHICMRTRTHMYAHTLAPSCVRTCTHSHICRYQQMCVFIDTVLDGRGEIVTLRKVGCNFDVYLYMEVYLDTRLDKSSYETESGLKICLSWCPWKTVYRYIFIFVYVSRITSIYSFIHVLKHIHRFLSYNRDGVAGWGLRRGQNQHQKQHGHRWRGIARVLCTQCRLHTCATCIYACMYTDIFHELYISLFLCSWCRLHMYFISRYAFMYADSAALHVSSALIFMFVLMYVDGIALHVSFALSSSRICMYAYCAALHAALSAGRIHL